MDDLPQWLTRAANETPKQSTEYLAVLKKWLAIYAEHYRQQVTEISVATYIHGLQELSPTVLDAACDAALKVCHFMPTVADILDSAKPPYEDGFTPQRGTCEACDGTGWKLVKVDGAKCATRCECGGKG